MSKYTACNHCAKSKDCLDSVQAHNFNSSCFEPLETAKKNLIEALTDLNYKILLLSRYIARDNCEKVCVNAGRPPCTEKDDCDTCTHKCKCQTCKNFSNLEIDWRLIEDDCYRN